MANISGLEESEGMDWIFNIILTLVLLLITVNDKVSHAVFFRAGLFESRLKPRVKHYLKHCVFLLKHVFHL